MKLRIGFLAASSAAFALQSLAHAQVTAVEAGHTVTKLVDSIVPVDPSDTLLETTLPVGTIESIAVDPLTTNIYVQLIIPPNVFHSVSSHIFKITPAGVVSVVSMNTHIGLTERGTDLGYDKALGLLVTEDQNSVPIRLASIHPVTGVIQPGKGLD